MRTMRGVSRPLGLLGLVAMLLASSPPAAGAAAPPALARSEVLRALAAAQETSRGAATGEHLALDGRIVTVPDGAGGTLTAVPAVRSPSADGYGQLVLFWHAGTLIGSDRLARLPSLGEESSQLEIVSWGTGFVTVRFWRYRPQDPMYLPSLPPAEVTYRWTGYGLQASSAVPRDSGDGLGVRLPDMALTRSDILAVTRPAVERSAQGPTGERLEPFGAIATVPDGFGGSLTAVPVVRWPTADGYGQMVLFWHDRTFLGSMRLAKLPNLGEEATQLKIVGSGTGFVTVRFWRYRPQDPMYLPSLPSEDVTYRWTGHGLAASAPVPKESGNGLAMSLGR